MEPAAPPAGDTGSHLGWPPTRTRAMQSSVVVALAQATLPGLWLLHCWHLRSSAGPTAHHTTRVRLASTSAVAAGRDTAVNWGTEPCRGHPALPTSLGPGSTPRALPAWPSRTCGPALLLDGRVPLLPLALCPALPPAGRPPCLSVPFSWLLTHPSVLSVTPLLISQSHRTMAPEHRDRDSPQEVA